MTPKLHLYETKERLEYCQEQKNQEVRNEQRERDGQVGGGATRALTCQLSDRTERLLESLERHTQEYHIGS